MARPERRNIRVLGEDLEPEPSPVYGGVQVCLMLYPGAICLRLSGDSKDLIEIPKDKALALTEFPTVPEEHDRLVFRSGVFEVIRRVFDFGTRPPKMIILVKKVSKEKEDGRKEDSTS